MGVLLELAKKLLNFHIHKDILPLTLPDVKG